MRFTQTTLLRSAVLTVVISTLPYATFAATDRFNKPTDLAVRYNATTEKVVATWNGPKQAKRYQVRLYHSGDLVTRDTVTQERKRFGYSHFDDGESYRIWVRVKATDTKRASRWTKTTYTADASATGVSVTEDDVYITTSSDATTFTDSATVAFDYASVPDIVRLTTTSAVGTANDLLVYYVDFEDYGGSGEEEIMMSRSSDNGTTWSDPTLVTISGFENDDTEVPVDPAVVQLPDGSLRLYFYGFPYSSSSEAKTTTDDPGTFYSATSSDGLNFTVEVGERFSDISITDPEVIYFNNQWILYYSLGTTSGIATSPDGLTFTAVDTWAEGGVPGAYTDGTTVYLYGCGLGGIVVESSSDGVSFADAATTAVMGPPNYTICDPAPTVLADNTIMLVYKKRPGS